MKICKIENCNNKHYAKGLCERHYAQFKKHGRIFKRTRFDKNEFIDCGDYYEIILYNNKNENVAQAKIDKNDYNLVKDRRWRLSHGYVKTNRNTLSLHSLITGNKNKHNNFINKDKLDYRCKNLRLFKGKKIKFDDNLSIFPFKEKKKEKKCKQKNCDGKHRAKGLCAKHYAQFLKYGKVLTRTRFNTNEVINHGENYDYYVLSLYNNKGYVIADIKVDKRDYNLIKDYTWRLNHYGIVITGRNNITNMYNMFFNYQPNKRIKFLNGNKMDYRRQNLRYE